MREEKYFDDTNEAISANCFALFPLNPLMESIEIVEPIIPPSLLSL